MNVQDDRQIKACEEDPECDVPYHQPGSAAGLPPFRDSNIKSCAEMTARIRAENPNVTRVSFEGLCPNGKSKIALAVDPDEDYHFWRQDSNGGWSGKPGSLKVSNKDASGRLVYDPALSDRDWSEKGSNLNYTHFCSYYCVPRDRHLFMKIGGAAASSSQAKQHRYSVTRRSSHPRAQGLRRNRTVRKDRDES